MGVPSLEPEPEPELGDEEGVNRGGAAENEVWSEEPATTIDNAGFDALDEEAAEFEVYG